jgi:hypothetical protein
VKMCWDLPFWLFTKSTGMLRNKTWCCKNKQQDKPTS